MGNNSSSKTIGIGSIRIRMAHGTNRTLLGVSHIPDMKRNLISLGALDRIGYRIAAEGGVLKVTRRNQLLLRGNRINNLYVLQYCTVIGSDKRSPVVRCEKWTTKSFAEEVEVGWSGTADTLDRADETLH